MALNTRNKRAAAVLPSLPWRGRWPIPDGLIDAGDRQQTAFLARLLARAPVILPEPEPDPPPLPPPPWTIPEAGGAGTVRVIRRRGGRW